MGDDLRLYFSLISGEMFYVESDEINNMDNTQIPLKNKPPSSCKKCYGRFYIGKHVQGKYYIPCPKCMHKCVDFDSINEEIVVESPKTVNEKADEQFKDALDVALANKS